MKKIYILFFFIFSFNCFSQSNEKQIFLKDAETNLPIEDVSVLILKTKQLLLSNAEGKISFILNGTSNIQFSHPAYKSITVRSSALQKTDNIIYLKSNINDLDEIIVTKQHPQKILKSIVENSIKKLTVPARLKVYSREFFKMDGNYSNYNDGLLNFQIQGKEKKFKSDILIEQNRSFGVINDYLSSEVLGYNLNDLMQNYYNFKYLLPIILSSAKNEYEYVIKANKLNPDYNVMIVTPLEKTKNLKDDFKIIYDNKNKLILEVNTELSTQIISNSKEKKTLDSKNIYKSIFKANFKLDNSNYYLISSKEEIGFEKGIKDKKINIEVRNYFVTTYFTTHNFTFKPDEAFKGNTLYKKKNVIHTNYWDVSGFVATEEEQKIIDLMAAKSYK
jgi:hypothetical protein